MISNFSLQYLQVPTRIHKSGFAAKKIVPRFNKLKKISLHWSAHPCKFMPAWNIFFIVIMIFCFPQSIQKFFYSQIKLFHFVRLKLYAQNHSGTFFTQWYYRNALATMTEKTWNRKITIKRNQCGKTSALRYGEVEVPRGKLGRKLSKLLCAQRIVWLRWLRYSKTTKKKFWARAKMQTSE